VDLFGLAFEAMPIGNFGNRPAGARVMRAIVRKRRAIAIALAVVRATSKVQAEPKSERGTAE
jgi:hypothetical protein